MDSTNEKNKKIIMGMAVLAVSGLLLGTVVGYFVTHKILEKTVLQEMIKEGYVLTSDATATSEDIVFGKTAYVNGELVNGSAFMFDTSDATATSDVILQGKTAYVNGELVVGTLPVIYGQNITPSAQASTISGNAYLKDDLIVKGDRNLVPENIKKGIKIFNVVGRFESEKTTDD